MRKYFGLVKKFPFQMSFITLGVILVICGIVLVYIEENSFAETPPYAAIFILSGITLVILAAKNMDKRLMRQLRSLAIRRFKHHYQRNKMWQNLN